MVRQLLLLLLLLRSLRNVTVRLYDCPRQFVQGEVFRFEINSAEGKMASLYVLICTLENNLKFCNICSVVGAGYIAQSV